jgi:hypothetical protein
MLKTPLILIMVEKVSPFAGTAHTVIRWSSIVKDHCAIVILHFPVMNGITAIEWRPGKPGTAF